jgi:HK97 family phage portal protein
MPILNTIASSLGSAVKAFQVALNGERRPVRRPAFLNTVAESEKWKGGDLGAKDAAYKRAVQNSWIYTSIDYKARELSAGRMYVSRNESGTEDGGVIVPNHPLTRILRKPNSLMGRGYLWRYTQWWLDLSGNAYWFLAPDEDDCLAEVWPIPANAVNPVPGDKERLVDYYEYTVNGRVFPIPAEYICHFRYPNPFDYFRGLAPLVAAMLPADSDSAMAHWNGEFFGSSNVMPSSVINLSSGNPNQPLDPQDVEQVREVLSSDFSASARRTVITSAYDMAVQLLGWNAKDMDFLAGRQFSKEEVYGIYGMPAGLLDKNATEANATTADNVFKEKTLWPLMQTVYADTITSQIIDNWYRGESLEAAFEDIRPVNKAQKMQEAGVSLTDLTRAERRKRYWDLPPLGDARDNEIPGAAQPMPQTNPPQQPSFNGLVPSIQSAVAAPARALHPDVLADLRRWKDVNAKSLGKGRGIRTDFVSTHIPASMKAAIIEELETPDINARDVFEKWMRGEASTKAAPFGQTSLTRDDPFGKIKRAAEGELEDQLNAYFEDLAQRIQEQVTDGAQ